jgi:hypothetical protein
MIFNRKNRTIQFIHIPKTAGTSIRKLLALNDWKVDRERDYYKAAGYVKSHPHHTREVYIKKNSDLDIDLSFAVVRNPVERALSEIFYICRGYESSILNKTNVSRDTITKEGVMHFMHGIFSKLMPQYGLGVDDNHWMPQHYFINDDTDVFKYEKIQNVIDFLASKSIIDNNHILPHINKSKIDRHLELDWSYAPDVTKYFYKLYKKDFKIFGYDMPEEILKYA